MNVLAAFGFDDLWLARPSSAESESFRALTRPRRLSARPLLFSFWRFFSRLGFRSASEVAALSPYPPKPRPAASSPALRGGLRFRRIRWSGHRCRLFRFPVLLPRLRDRLGRLIQPFEISRLNFASFGFGVADRADGLARTFAGSGIVDVRWPRTGKPLRWRIPR